jgi:hypothetical protein
MFQFFQNKEYRKKTLANMEAILALHPKGFASVIKETTGLNNAIENFYKNNVTELSAAVLLSAKVITDYLDHFTKEQLDEVLKQIQIIDNEEFSAWMLDVLNKKDSTPPKNVSFLGLFIYQATNHIVLLQDKIPKQDTEYFGSEVIGRLQGLTEEERFERRLNQLANELVEPLSS